MNMIYQRRQCSTREEIKSHKKDSQKLANKKLVGAILGRRALRLEEIESSTNHEAHIYM